MTDIKARLSWFKDQIYHKKRVMSSAGGGAGNLTAVRINKEDKKEGLICAKGTLSGIGDSEIDDMIYEERNIIS